MGDGMAIACSHDQICLNGQITGYCPENSYAEGAESVDCTTCAAGTLVRVQGSEPTCVPGKMIDICLFEQGTGIEMIRQAIANDSCVTTCYDDEVSGICKYAQTNYQESRPNIGVAIYVMVIVMFAICFGMLTDRCSSHKVICVETDHTPFISVEPKYVFNGLATFISILAIVILSVSTVYFVARGKQGNHNYNRRSLQIVAFRPAGSTSYGFSPLIGIDYPEGSNWKKLYYMRANTHNWQQSERIMVGNLIDLPTAHAMLARNYFSQIRVRWNGAKPKYKPILRLDPDNDHNANLCVADRDWFSTGPNRACQSRLYELFIVSTIVSGIALFITIFVMCGPEL